MFVLGFKDALNSFKISVLSTQRKRGIMDKNKVLIRILSHRLCYYFFHCLGSANRLLSLTEKGLPLSKHCSESLICVIHATISHFVGDIFLSPFVFLCYPILICGM